jgi:hypothetical protein
MDSCDGLSLIDLYLRSICVRQMAPRLLALLAAALAVSPAAPTVASFGHGRHLLVPGGGGSGGGSGGGGSNCLGCDIFSTCLIPTCDFYNATTRIVTVNMTACKGGATLSWACCRSTSCTRAGCTGVPGDFGKCDSTTSVSYYIPTTATSMALQVRYGLHAHACRAGQVVP